MRYVTYEPSPRDKPTRAEVTVRRAHGDADIAVCAGLSARYNDEGADVALSNARTHAAYPLNAVYVACAPAGEVVGYARITWVASPSGSPDNVAPTGYYLGGMVVDEPYRRRGVGQRLTVERLNHLRGLADEAWYLVNSANTASIDLHVAQGFHEATRDFVFPGVVFDGLGGILCHKTWGPQARECPGCAVTT
jgi:ribosomal protein S18 acetylase RimI-like enzyme